MFSIKYTAKAENNLFEIYSYIAEDNPFMAAKVILQIKSSMEILKIFPLSWRVLEEDYRCVVESKHNYKIVYKFSEGVIYIISISKYRDSWK